MLLFYIYLAAFVVGGALLAASLFLGGHEADVAVDAAGAATEERAEHGPVAEQRRGLSLLWAPFLSVRFWVFFLCFFGLTGLVLTLLALAANWTTLGAALGLGSVIGFAAAFLNLRLKGAPVVHAPAVEASEAPPVREPSAAQDDESAGPG